MNRKNTLLTIAILLSSSSMVQATAMNYQNSLIAAPGLMDTVIVRGPLVIGIANDVTGKALKEKPVAVYIDRRLVAAVPTNKYGVWSYILNADQQLTDGAHMVQACVALASGNTVWTQASLFYVDGSRKPALHRSGNVDAANSNIDFPFEGADINTSTPTIVGSLENSANYPVVGETLQIKINGVNIASVTSDSNGVFSYQVSTALSDGDYTVGAHCVQSNVDLTTNDFTIDTTPPAAPTITSPLQDASGLSSTVIVTGTTEPYATITVFLDGDTFGDITYADPYGNWSIEYDGLSDGSHSVTAQATDLAENTGPVSSETDFTVS